MRRYFGPLLALMICVAVAAYVAWQWWSDPERRFQQGRAALQAKDWPAVEVEIQRLGRDPRYAAQRALLLGAMLLRQGQPREALEALVPCRDHPDLQGEALVLTGQALYEMGEAGRAKLWWERALELNPNDAEAHRWMGVMYYDLGAMDHALRHLQRVSELDPDDPRPDRLMGLVNKEYERTHLAIQHYRESLRRAPHQTDAESVMLELAEAEIKEKEFAAALETSKKCPPSVRQRVIQAECYLNLGDQASARDLLSAALQESPRDFKALILQGQMLMERGEVEQAVASFQQAVEVNPHDYHARFHLVQALRRAGRNEEAETQDRVSQELRDLWAKFSDLHVDAINQPTNAELRCEIGEIAKRLGRPDLAQIWHRAALAIDPTNQRALRGLRDAVEGTSSE